MKKFIINVALLFISLSSIVIGINYFIDASGAITPGSYYGMARLALSGNIVATSLNYNERLYQVAIIETMQSIPNTIVIGCSRGMFLGEEITKYKNLYNNCVSAACMEDYYAILGLYNKKFSKLPQRVIVETSPWIFYKYNPSSRWKEQDVYASEAKELYKLINGKDLVINRSGESPYISIPYFRHNLEVFVRDGIAAFKRKTPRISTNISEAADYPDGSLRYAAHLENESEERLKGVQNTKGAVTYQDSNNMTELNKEKISDYENMLDFLISKNVEVIIYLQPFSVTQCHYSFDEGLNAVFLEAERYLHELGIRRGVKIVGGFDARDFGLSDERFIDFMHLDKKGTKIVWETYKLQQKD